MDANSLLTKDIDWFQKHVRTSQYFTQIVKCQDTSCCSNARSSYFTVVPSRFFPPPIPIVQTCEGLKAPDGHEDSSKNKFPSLFAAQTLKPDIILPPTKSCFKVLPYDLYCPSVESSLSDRMCHICHMYFASQVMMRRHLGVHRATVGPARTTPVAAVAMQRIRPLRIAAKRQREMMAIILQNEVEFAEWIDRDNLDTDGMDIPDDNADNNSQLPIMTVEQHLSSPWTNE
jgi:hypothetical protein